MKQSVHNLERTGAEALQCSTTAPPKTLTMMSGVTTLEPFQITRKQLYLIFSSPRLVKRMLAAGWIDVVRQGKSGREALYDYASAKAAYQRYRTGEEPPRLDWEKRQYRQEGDV